ncbi:hypothetical protein Anapl_05644 [Anas platyrhynchos]|uniref:Uncharacterized protein n=1 Tax=Anas platyrhynchos TaxID=8839 RepID=R0M1M6_ANAPL|nr:hypothetical protein Anapl_05644 [Anas platyrhynchos]
MLKTLQSQEKKNTVVTGSRYTLLDWSQENSLPFSTAGKATAARDTATGDRQSQPRNQAPQSAQCPVVQGQGIAHHSHDLLIGETGAAEASWLPQARQESAVPLILSASSRVALCILSTKSFADTNNIPGPVPLVFVGVESSLLNASAAPPDWELDKITSPEAKLHPGIRSCIIFTFSAGPLTPSGNPCKMLIHRVWTLIKYLNCQYCKIYLHNNERLFVEFLSLFLYPALTHVKCEPDPAAVRADGSSVIDFSAMKVKSAIFQLLHGPGVLINIFIEFNNTNSQCTAGLKYIGRKFAQKAKSGIAIQVTEDKGKRKGCSWAQSCGRTRFHAPAAAVHGRTGESAENLYSHPPRGHGLAAPSLSRLRPSSTSSLQQATCHCLKTETTAPTTQAVSPSPLSPFLVFTTSGHPTSANCVAGTRKGTHPHWALPDRPQKAASHGPRPCSLSCLRPSSKQATSRQLFGRAPWEEPKVLAKLLLSSPQAMAVSHPAARWGTWGTQRSSEGHGAPQSVGNTGDSPSALTSWDPRRPVHPAPCPLQGGTGQAERQGGESNHPNRSIKLSKGDTENEDRGSSEDVFCSSSPRLSLSNYDIRN